uniref:Flotillin n=1 Tax=Anser brachyrhynchus TaxID=132585 RepID=A0A8B9IB74_9AVES
MGGPTTRVRTMPFLKLFPFKYQAYLLAPTAWQSHALFKSSFVTRHASKNSKTSSFAFFGGSSSSGAATLLREALPPLKRSPAPSAGHTPLRAAPPWVKPRPVQEGPRAFKKRGGPHHRAPFKGGGALLKESPALFLNPAPFIQAPPISPNPAPFHHPYARDQSGHPLELLRPAKLHPLHEATPPFISHAPSISPAPHREAPPPPSPAPLQVAGDDAGGGRGGGHAGESRTPKDGAGFLGGGSPAPGGVPRAPRGRGRLTQVTGAARAAAVAARARAEAAQTEAKAEAFAQFREAAVVDMVLQRLPQVAEAVAQPLLGTRRVTLVAGSSGDIGVARLPGEILDVVTRLPAAVEALTGVSVTQAAQKKSDCVA